MANPMLSCCFNWRTEVLKPAVSAMLNASKVAAHKRLWWKQVYTTDLKSVGLTPMRVRFPPVAPNPPLKNSFYEQTKALVAH
jgi:hypothetical protein